MPSSCRRARPSGSTLKQQLLARADAACDETVVIASSTSGLLPSLLQEGMRHPERLVVGHPFNPVYLLPLVEVVAGSKRSDDAVARAESVYRGLGMRPLLLDAEVDGFVADRLLEALWREALWLVDGGVATVSQIDDAIRFGAGLRWSAMGTFLVYRMAGGEAGMRHFMEQFGPALQWPWTKLTDVPELTDELLDRLVAQSDEQAGGQLDPRARGAARRLPRRRDARPEGCRLRRRRGRRRARGAVAPTGRRGRVPIVFDDGHRTELHHLWLRDNCECAECVHPQTRERLLDTFALDPDVAPTSVDVDGRQSQHRVERRPSQRLPARSACASGARARHAPGPTTRRAATGERRWPGGCPRSTTAR